MIRFIKDGDFDYNEKLKTICRKDEWNSILRSILDELCTIERKLKKILLSIK